jgi:hypothetical protein
MNRKGFSQLAKVKGPRPSDGQLGSAAIQGTFTGGRIPATGRGTNPLKGPRGARRR